jgi:hypothetical protein
MIGARDARHGRRTPAACAVMKVPVAAERWANAFSDSTESGVRLKETR